MLVTLVFAIGLGLWFHVAMRRAEEHARLLDKLQATQTQLARTNHEAGVLAERERLAREIHDTLAQGFTSVVMQAQAATAALDVGDDGAVRERLHVVEDTARDNLAEARALVAAFAPVGAAGRLAPPGAGPARDPVRGGDRPGGDRRGRRRRRAPAARSRWCCCGPPRRRSRTCGGTRGRAPSSCGWGRPRER